jgi:CBS domain-containing protein
MNIDEFVRKARICSPESDLATTGRLMDEIGCGILPVAGDQGQVVGVITDRDICLALTRRDVRASQLAVREVMTIEPVTCKIGCSLREALRAMASARVRRLPVVDENGRLQGILSLDDLVVEVPDPEATEVARTLRAVNEHLLPALSEPA